MKLNVPVEDHKWHDLSEYSSKTGLPKGHRIEYARTDDGIVVRIVGPNAHVWGKSGPGKDALEKAIDFALEWFRKVGEEL